MLMLKNVSKHFLTGFVNYCQHMEPTITCELISANKAKGMAKSLGIKL